MIQLMTYSLLSVAQASTSYSVAGGEKGGTR